MQVLLVSDHALIKSDSSLPANLRPLTGLMVRCGVYESCGLHTPHEAQYKAALTALLEYECEESLKAIVVLKWDRGALWREGLTWLWLLKDNMLIAAYTHTSQKGGGVPTSSFLDVLCSDLPSNQEAWTYVFDCEIKKALAGCNSIAA